MHFSHFICTGPVRWRLRFPILQMREPRLKLSVLSKDKHLVVGGRAREPEWCPEVVLALPPGGWFESSITYRPGGGGVNLPTAGNSQGKSAVTAQTFLKFC